MRDLFRVIALISFVLAGGTQAFAQTVSIPGLYVTGVNNSNVQLGSNVQDSHYVITASAASTLGNSYTVTTLGGGWMANPGPARWIVAPGSGKSGTGSDGSNTTRQSGNYDYALTFTMPAGAQLTTVSISGAFASDNATTILVNGVQAIASNGSAGSTTNFTLNSSNSTFVAGANTITFRVNNTSKDATGLLVSSLSGTAVVPEVGSFLPLLGAGAAYGVAAIIRLRQRRRDKSPPDDPPAS